MLDFLREHPRAPIFRNESGNRLTASEVECVRAFEDEVLAARVGWMPGGEPDWVGDFLAGSVADVPFYRAYGSAPRRLADCPTISRADLSRDVAQFVPDSVPVARLINFRTSGTTGHPLLLASHPVVAASYLAFHRRALRRFGIELQHGRGQVGVVLLGLQRKCFTYVSVTPTRNESGLAKINLHPNDWRDPADRAAYLDALAPEVLAGDPISFAELLTLPVTLRPRALLSTSMTLLAGLRGRLEARFGCPVLDLYSMNEAGPIAVADARVGGHVLLQPRIYVEILDAAGRAVTNGQRGEVTLTGGFNFCLPLLRYRTGDFASLQRVDGEPVLMGLEGRPPVRFRTMTGEWVNNIEVTHAIQRLAIPQFALHQFSDGGLRLQLAGAGTEAHAATEILHGLFGMAQSIRVEAEANFAGKVVQYTSDLASAAP
ncbi:acyl-CoA synthetase family protein [Horticoccus sp. 23ND18S-11]|uniref:capsule biosynthesis protein CapK n=1 Tax=Horticoccus sp. 23ND18S-11 TaxID=3391832 RepID=UPI0039C8DB03